MRKSFCCTVVSLACLTTAWASGTAGAHKPDGTNVWIGAASGGNLATLSNWRAESPTGLTVEQLMKKHVVFDFSGRSDLGYTAGTALADGAILVNDLALGNDYKEGGNSASTMLAGVIMPNAAGAWSMQSGTGGKCLYFCSPCYIDVPVGVLTWVDIGQGWYPSRGPHKRGAGTFRFTGNTGNGNWWNATGFVEEGTLEFTKGAGTVNDYIWKVMSGATMKVSDGTSELPHVYSDSTASAETKLEVAADAKLYLSTGFGYYQAYCSDFYGELIGSGVLRSIGGIYRRFLKGAKTGPNAFSGTLQPYCGDLIFGTADAPCGVLASAKATVDGGASLRFGSAQTLATIDGEGSDGGIDAPALAAGGSDVTGTTRYRARLKGGDFTKQGANYRLDLTGASTLTGAVRVAAGTLSVTPGVNRPGLRAAWCFEDETDIGHDSSEFGNFNLTQKTLKIGATGDVFGPDTNYVRLVDDGVVGRAVHFDDPQTTGTSTPLDRGACLICTNIDSHPLQAPAYNGSFTISHWVRPAKNCGGAPFYLHFWAKEDTGDGWNNRQSFWIHPNSKFGNLSFNWNGWTRDTKTDANSRLCVNLGGGGWGAWCDGKWHHIVFTYDGATRRVTAYVDGVIGKRTDNGEDGSLILPGDYNMSANMRMTVGSYASNDDVNHKFAGDIDEIMYFRGCWTAEEVAAEYAAKNPRRGGGRTVPAPVARWTFDERIVKDGGLEFADMTGNGNTLVAGSTNTAKTVAEQFPEFPVKYPADFGSKSPKCGYAGWYFALKDGHTLGELVPSGSSFTLSVRMAYNFDGIGVTFGDPENNAKNVRFGDTGCPRIPYWYVGSSSATSYGDGGLHGWNDSTDPNVIGAWSAYTLVYDAASKTYEMYRDGCRVKCGAATVSMDAKGLWLGWNGRTGGNAVYKGLYLKFDDITIWNQVLTPAEVARHVRALQHSADGQYAAEAARSVLPTNVAVTVDADAKIRFQTGADHVVKSLAGAGEVTVEGGATLKVGTLDRFAGSLKGTGGLIVDGISTTLAAAGSATPIFAMDAGAKLVVPATGAVSIANATEDQIYGKKWLVAKGGTYALPENFSGWTVVQPAGAYANAVQFVEKDGDLYLRLRSFGLVLIFK